MLLFFGSIYPTVVSIPDGQTFRWIHTATILPLLCISDLPKIITDYIDMLDKMIQSFTALLHTKHKQNAQRLVAIGLQQVAFSCLPGYTISAEENSFPRRATRPGRARNGRRGTSWMPWFLSGNASHRILQPT